MAGIGDFLGSAAKSDVAQQLFLWGVLYGLLGTVFEPVTTEIGQEVWEGAVAAGLHRALSPDLLAVMVVRGWIDEATGQAEALKNGINQGDFDRMVSNARNPISPEEAAVALRRQLIPEDAAPGVPSYLNAIRQGNLGDQWAEVVKDLAKQIPTPADILQAVLEGQVPDGVDPRALYERVGGQALDPNDGFDWYTLMFNTRGSAPTPNEAATMANRGIIPWDGQGPGVVSFYQAFLEGPWRNKWLEPFIALREYFPPPRTITAMVREGSLSDEQATELYAKQGLSPELTAAYLTSAHHQKTATTHELARSTLQELYRDQLITRQQLIDALVAQNWSAEDADFLAQVVDVRRQQQALNAVLSKVHTLYVGHKVELGTVQGALDRMGITGEQQQGILELWNLERDANTADLTPAQIEAAFFYKVIDQADAQQRLERRGYTPHDAWVALSVRSHTALPGEPPRDAIPGGN